MLIDVHCPSCGADTERLYRGGHSVDREAACLAKPCESCGQPVVKAYRVGTAPTPWQWGDTQWDRYDRGLGERTYSKQHRDARLKELGMRPAEEVR